MRRVLSTAHLHPSRERPGYGYLPAGQERSQPEHDGSSHGQPERHDMEAVMVVRSQPKDGPDEHGDLCSQAHCESVGGGLGYAAWHQVGHRIRSLPEVG